MYIDKWGLKQPLATITSESSQIFHISNLEFQFQVPAIPSPAAQRTALYDAKRGDEHLDQESLSDYIPLGGSSQ